MTTTRLAALAALLALLSTPLLAASVTPGAITIGYPTAGLANVMVNPTIWWGPYSQTSTGTNDFTIAPVDFQVEIAVDAASVVGTCDAADFTTANRRYSSWTSSTEPDSMDCRPGHACHGAGMAHLVCDANTWTGDQDSDCGTFWASSAPDTAASLAENTSYCVRARWLMSMADLGADTCGGTLVPLSTGTVCAGAYSPIVRFTTVDYSDTPNRFAHTAARGTGTCASKANACTFSTAVGSGATPGDYIEVLNECSNAATTPCDNDGDCTGGGTCVVSTYSLASKPTTSDSRLKIVGASATARPIITAAYYTAGYVPLTGDTAMNEQFWILAGTSDLYIANLDIRGQETAGGCCNYTCSTTTSTACDENADCPGGEHCGADGGGNSDSNSRWYLDCNTTPTRTTFVNTDFRHIQFYCGSPGTNDLTMVGVLSNMEASNGPPKEVFVAWTSSNLTNSAFSNANAQRTTFHHVEFRGGKDILMEGPDDMLVEGSLFYNFQNHPFRFDSDCARHTYRRLEMGDGPEGLSWAAGEGAGHGGSGIANLVVEDSTFANAFNLTNCAGNSTGTVNYVVVRNTIFQSHPAINRTIIFGDTPLGLCTCPAGEDCDLYNSSVDRMVWEYNSEWKLNTTDELRNWEGSAYVRCDAGANLDYAAIEAFPTNKHEIANAGACADGRDDSRDPLVTTIKSNDPDGAFNFTLQASSPAIDAGHPDYLIPTGGGSRVDIGAVEYTTAPPAGRRAIVISLNDATRYSIDPDSVARAEIACP